MLLKRCTSDIVFECLKARLHEGKAVDKFLKKKGTIHNNFTLMSVNYWIVLRVKF